MEAFGNEVLAAWDKMAKYHVEEQLVGSRDLKILIKKLRPIRHELRSVAQPFLTANGVFQDLSLRILNLHQQAGRGRVILTSHIRLSAAPSRAITEGRLQMTFCPDGRVRSEYVCYPRTRNIDDEFQIEKIARWSRNAQWVAALIKGCNSLRPDFRISLGMRNGASIEKPIRDMRSSDWKAIQKNGIDIKSYFLFHCDRERGDLAGISVDELAQLMVDDLAQLGPIYHILQKGAKNVGRLPGPSKSVVVRGVRRKSEIPPVGTYSPELKAPRRSYEVDLSVKPECRHYVVIDSLSETLENAGRLVGNDQLRDLYIKRGKTITHLFEAKTSISRHDLYSAVGQLLLHGNALDETPELIAILPGEPNLTTQNVLKKLGIKILTYAWNGDSPEFLNLSEIIDLEKSI